MMIINKGSTVYYARIHHETGIYELCELHVRTVYADSFVGVDTQSKVAYYISFEDCDVFVFDNRNDALHVVQKAEKLKKDFTIDSSDE